jgi:peptide/nickel transport system substrate-binding protein
MNRKILAIVLLLSMTLMLVTPIGHAAAPTVPNPGILTYTTIGGPCTDAGTDPGASYDTASSELEQQVYEPLFMYNRTSFTQVIPLLADNWLGYGVNPGNWITPSDPDPAAPVGTNQTWYFHIRQGVKWQDNDTYGDLTTYDVVYTFQRNMLQDFPTYGVQWLTYVPLLGCTTFYNSLDPKFDLDGDGAINETEFSSLLDAVRGSVQCNATWVWFNLPTPYPSFFNILTQSWAFIMSKGWCIDHGCWKVGAYDLVNHHFVDDDNYTEFTRTYYPSQSPLMPSGIDSTPMDAAMGTGPYILSTFNPDPHTGYQIYTANTKYWRAVAPTGTVIIKIVEEWANRKAQFLSSSPSLQCDMTDVPRANAPELHNGGVLGGPDSVIAGLNLTEIDNIQAADYLFFCENLKTTSTHIPKLGTTANRTLFADVNLRLAFIYAFNVTQFIKQYFLGEAFQPTSYMCKGTNYYNESALFYRYFDVPTAQHYLDLAWGGKVKSQGLTLELCYNTGNIARYTVASMIADVLMNRLTWGPSAIVNIQPTAIPWADYLTQMYGKLPVFNVGWIADFPDPADWAGPFMSPSSIYAGWAQRVNYSWDLTDVYANWMTGPMYGPPPYNNSLHEHVTDLNNSYIDHIIYEASHTADTDLANRLYNELMDIFYAEAFTLPVDQGLGRHYQRNWVFGWQGGYSNSPLAVGHYFYELYKAVPVGVGPSYYVNLNAQSTITNTSKVYQDGMVAVFASQFASKQLNYSGSKAYIYYNVSVSYLNATGPPLVVELGIKRTNTMTGKSRYILVDTKTIIANTKGWWIESWEESTTGENASFYITFHADPVASAGGAVTIPTNPGVLDVNSTYMVMIGPPIIGDLGGGSPVPKFFAFNGKCDSQDIPLFLQCYRQTAPANAKYLGDLGSGSPVPHKFVFNGKCDQQDIPLFLQCYRRDNP